MNIKWFAVGPHIREATHGPYLARITRLERGWYKMLVFLNGVWTNTISSAPANLEKQFAEIVERYELERDRERLDWLDASEMGQRGGFFVWDDGGIASGCVNGGKTIRQAVDDAMECERRRERHVEAVGDTREAGTP